VDLRHWVSDGLMALFFRGAAGDQSGLVASELIEKHSSIAS
jgi:hypothetical protein